MTNQKKSSRAERRAQAKAEARKTQEQDTQQKKTEANNASFNQRPIRKELIDTGISELSFIIGSGCLAAAWFIQTVIISDLTEKEEFLSTAYNERIQHAVQGKIVKDLSLNFQLQQDRFYTSGQEGINRYWTEQINNEVTYGSMVLARWHSLQKMKQGKDSLASLGVQYSTLILEQNKQFGGYVPETDQNISDDSAKNILNSLRRFTDTINARIKREEDTIVMNASDEGTELDKKKTRNGRWSNFLLATGSILVAFNPLSKLLIKYRLNRKKNIDTIPVNQTQNENS